MQKKVVVDFEFECNDIVFFRDATHTKTSKPQPFMVTHQGCVFDGDGEMHTLFALTGVNRYVKASQITKEMPPMTEETIQHRGPRTGNVLDMLRGVFETCGDPNCEVCREAGGLGLDDDDEG